MVPPGYAAPLFPWLTQQGQTSDSEFIAEFQDLYSHGMDRALGMQETSLDTAVKLQSQAVDFYRNAFASTPVLSAFFQTAANFLASCMELQMKCLTLTLPGMVPGILPASSRRTDGPVHQSAEELAHYVDMGSGQRKNRAPERHAAAAGTSKVS
jgi:hypothetical protein